MTTKTYTCSNLKDTGSLHVGTSKDLGNLTIAVGDKLQIVGENKVREVTYTMGKGEKLHVCAKGTGPFPLAEKVEFKIFPKNAAVAPSEEAEQEAA